jgi:hypothetical protein
MNAGYVIPDPGAPRPRVPKTGDRLVYRVFGGEERTITVTDTKHNIKNGRAGFFGDSDDGLAVWGYDDQIVRFLP